MQSGVVRERKQSNKYKMYINITDPCISYVNYVNQKKKFTVLIASMDICVYVNVNKVIRSE